MAFPDKEVEEEKVLKMPRALYTNFTPVLVHHNDDSNALVTVVSCNEMVHGGGTESCCNQNWLGMNNRLEDLFLTQIML